MEKVLLFWFWRQAKKYVQYYSSLWRQIDIVRKNNVPIEGHAFFTFRQIKKLWAAFFKSYKLIVVAANHEEQEKIISYLLELWIELPILIEKPVTYNMRLLRTLVDKENYFFAVQEIYISQLYEGSQKNDSLIITAWFIDRDNWEHIMWCLLTLQNWLVKNILENHILKIDTANYDTDFNSLSFSVALSNKTTYCKKGIFSCNGIFVTKNIFLKFLEYFEKKLILDLEKNHIIKLNFYEIEKFFLSHFKNVKW